MACQVSITCFRQVQCCRLSLKTDLRRQVSHRLANVIHQSLDFGIQDGLQGSPLFGMVAALLPQGSNLTALLLQPALQVCIPLQRAPGLAAAHRS